MRRLLIHLLLAYLPLFAVACATLPTTPSAPVVPTATFQPPPTPILLPRPAEATAAPPTATASPSPPAIPPSPTPSPTPHPLAGVTLDALRARDYPGGPVEILATLERTDVYTRYHIAYPSDGLRLTGIMQVPTGAGPFPVIILNHGYAERDAYWPGSGTWMAAEFLNRRGYLTVAPDYRSWGASEWGPSLFHTGLLADVLNLIGALATVPEADTTRLGMWGHSMGGGITTKALTVDPRIRAAVLYAANSADDADLIARWGPGCLPGETQYTTKCNPAEVILPDLPPEIVADYLAAAADPAMLQQIAPIHHLDHVTAPVQIHIGAADGAEHNATPPEWSVKLHDALLAAGRSSELFVYEGQGHLFVGTAWTEMMTRAADFFDAHVK
jgi:dienelactone hydrolase